MTKADDPHIYVLRVLEDYEEALATGTMVDASLESEGFIHASPADQLTRVANKYYRGRGRVVCCVVDPTKLRAELKWEPAAGGLYPHIYGPLNMDAVVRTVPLRVDPEGHFDIRPGDLEAVRATNAAD